MRFIVIVIVIFFTGCGNTSGKRQATQNMSSESAAIDRPQTNLPTSKESRQLMKQPWVTHSTGKLLKTTPHFKIYAYSQPSNTLGDENGCRPQAAKFSVVHEKDFDHRFSRSYLDELSKSYNFFGEGQLRCGDIKTVTILIYIDGLFRNHLGEYSERVESIGSHSDHPFVSISLVYDSALRTIRSGTPLFTAFPIHPANIEEELESVNSTIAFKKRGGRTKETQRKIDEMEVVCANRVGTKMAKYYQENFRSKGSSRIPEFLHCGQFDRLSDRKSDYEKGRIFMAFVEASDQICKLNTPNGATTFTLTQAWQKCKQDRLGNKYDCQDLPSNDKDMYVDRALASKFQYYSDGRRNNFGPALKEFLNDPLFSEFVQLIQNFSQLLKYDGCLSETHQLIQANLLRFANGQNSYQSSK